MKTYTASVYVKHIDHYTKPQPHPIWWRRLLGQTISHEVPMERVCYTFNAPEEMINQEWFMNLIWASFNQHKFARMPQLEEMRATSEYIPTRGTIEPTRTNLIITSANDQC